MIKVNRVNRFDGAMRAQVSIVKVCDAFDVWKVAFIKEISGLRADNAHCCIHYFLVSKIKIKKVVLALL